MRLVEVLKILLAAAMVITAAEAIWLEMPMWGNKCVHEEIRNNVVVLANYLIIPNEENPQATISVKVTSPLGNNLHREENVTYGKFSFTTAEPGNYIACFRMNNHVRSNKSVTIALRWRTGIDAKDWDSIAKKEKVEGVGLELMKLEGSVQAIREKFVYLQKREEEMREVSERTNAAVAWFGIISLIICVLAADVQIWCLKRFFRKKKLI